MTDQARLDIRLPAADRERFESVALAAGDRSVSSWALRMLRAMAAKPLDPQVSADRRKRNAKR